MEWFEHLLPSAWCNSTAKRREGVSSLNADLPFMIASVCDFDVVSVDVRSHLVCNRQTH